MESAPGALVSAIPDLLPYTLPLCLAVLALLTLINLRGVRSTGMLFLLPTCLFVGTLFTIIGVGEELAEAPARQQGMNPPRLAVLRSEYRQLFAPLLGFVTGLAEQHPDRQIAVIVPELVELRWYHYLLHNHTASIIKALLLYRGGPQIVIVSTPWYLRDWKPERRRMLRLRGSFKEWRAARGRAARV